MYKPKVEIYHHYIYSGRWPTYTYISENEYGSFGT